MLSAGPTGARKLRTITARRPLAGSSGRGSNAPRLVMLPHSVLESWQGRRSDATPDIPVPPRLIVRTSGPANNFGASLPVGRLAVVRSLHGSIPHDRRGSYRSPGIISGMFVGAGIRGRERAAIRLPYWQARSKGTAIGSRARQLAGRFDLTQVLLLQGLTARGTQEACHLHLGASRDGRR